jgi:hypothetical protein
VNVPLDGTAWLELLPEEELPDEDELPLDEDVPLDDDGCIPVPELLLCTRLELLTALPPPSPPSSPEQERVSAMARAKPAVSRVLTLFIITSFGWEIFFIAVSPVNPVK